MEKIHILSCNKPLDATSVVFARKDRCLETRQDMKPRVLFLLNVVIKKDPHKRTIFLHIYFAQDGVDEGLARLLVSVKSPSWSNLWYSCTPDKEILDLTLG